MNRRLINLAALALPLLGLGAVWLQTELQSREGTEWDVPVQGYDPRDLLRGHYVQFQYDWPGPDPDAGRTWSALCLVGSPPNLVRAVPIMPDGTAAGNPACVQVAGQIDPRGGQAANTFGGRLYAPKNTALDLQGKLGDPKLQGLIRIRLRPDGHITPLRMTFRPRPPRPEGETDADQPPAVNITPRR